MSFIRRQERALQRSRKVMEPEMCKVLLVDDDAAIREALEAVLVSGGHDVASIQDGPAALRAAVEIRPDVIISDVNMPQLEGPDAVRILKTLPRFYTLPVVLMSGAEPPVTGLAQFTLRKPVVVEQLLKLVGNLSWASTSPPRASQHPPPPPAYSSPDEGWNPALAIASLGPYSDTECAVRICRGIELMHAQAARIERLRSHKMNVEESVRLYDRLVESVASLVQYLPARATWLSERKRRGSR
ncbi:response regulator [Paraburkholderia sp. HD33-4]|uniref:response regulator n=1 Tax=Paraburkholderia sp. HD33-4 TaxID=2883242 RepID=UPI001F3FB891|nr:response regulator [Paraburkholderia sp. HD33-4]